MIALIKRLPSAKLVRLPIVRRTGRLITLPVPSEAAVQAAVIDYLLLRGAVLVRVNGGMMPTAAGRRVRFNVAKCPGRTGATCSDILACWRGRFLALEVKRPGGRATAGQGEFLSAVREAGGLAAVVDSVRDVERLLGLAEQMS